MENTVEIIRNINNGSVMDTIERFHIHRAIREGIYLNDMHEQTNKPIFEVVLNLP
jgi:hypothetical protein